MYCTVCMNNNRKHKNKSYFNYPKDSAKRNEWLKAVGREDLIAKFLHDKVSQQYRICEDHFEKTYIKYSKNRTVKFLFGSAFPTLNLPSNDGATTSQRGDAQLQVPIQENLKTKCFPINEESSSSHCSFNKIITLEGQRSCSIQTDPVIRTVESRSTQTPLHLSADTPRKRKLAFELREAKNNKKCDLDSVTKEEFLKLCDKFIPRDMFQIIKLQLSTKTGNTGNGK